MISSTPSLKLWFIAVILTLTTGLTACTGAGALSQGYTPSAEAISQTASIAKQAPTVDIPSSANDYKLSPEEAAFECKKLAGLVQLRILEVRSGMKPEEASTISRTIQATNALFGGPTRGLSAGSEHQRQVGQLVAYNNALANKNCRSFDLAQALSSNEAVPSPTVAPKTSR